MTSRALCLCLLLLPAASRAATSDEQLLQRATTAFEQGVHARGTPQESTLFQEAAADFAELRQRGYRSPALCLDEGNACLLANDLPGAILAYRRGLDLAPNDGRLRAGLKYARAQVAYPHSALGRQPAERWPPWLPRPTPFAGWTALFAVYGLAWIFLMRWWITRQRKVLVLAGCSLAVALLIGVGLAWSFRQRQWLAGRPLVVIAQADVYLRMGNGPLYERRFDAPVARGVEARLQTERNGWLQIELADGAIGWVPRSAVLVEEP